MEQILYPRWYLDKIRKWFTHSKAREVLRSHPLGCIRVVWYCHCPSQAVRRHPAHHIYCWYCDTASTIIKEPVYDVPKELYTLMEKMLSREQINALLIHHAEHPFHYKRYFTKFTALRMATLRVLFFDGQCEHLMIDFLHKCNEDEFTQAMKLLDSLVIPDVKYEDALAIRYQLLQLRENRKIVNPHCFVFPRPPLMDHTHIIPVPIVIFPLALKNPQHFLHEFQQMEKLRIL